MKVPETEDSFDSSPASLNKDARAQQTKTRSNSTPYIIFVLLLLCVGALGYSVSSPTSKVVPPNIAEDKITDPPAPELFNFLVFCPKKYQPLAQLLQNATSEKNDDLRRRLLSSINTIELKDGQDPDNYHPERIYEVQITSRVVKVNGENVNKLMYCGLTRGFYETDCSNAKFNCLTEDSPITNPMFDIQTGESIDIIWINTLNPAIVPNLTICSSDRPHYCTIHTKVNRTQTFSDPTDQTIESKTKKFTKSVEISTQHWAATTHVHGAEVRPTFDGNPLSWIDNSKEFLFGPGALSIDNDCYYGAFDSIDSEGRNYNPPKLHVRNAFTNAFQNNSKTNRYPNLQNPGTLWYHDHAMRLTLYNVKHGLAGFYTLRDPKVEKQIGVERENEKLVMITETALVPSFPLTGFVAGVVYRFRFLNNNFLGKSDGVYRISFSYNGCNEQESFQYREKFTIIGADSSLFNTGIYDQRSFVVTQAERMEILIIFQEKQSFSICGEHINEVTPTNPDQKSKQNIEKKIIKGIQLKPKSSSVIVKNVRQNISDVNLDVAYTDLSLMSESDIAVQRMRPLISVAGIFTISGRVEFHSGRSEDPLLGSTEDWFLANTLIVGHPIHIHLINFQVMNQFILRKIQYGQGQQKIQCALYELDYLIEALKISTNPDVEVYKRKIILEGGGIDYEFACKHRNPVYAFQSIKNDLAAIFPEDDSSKRVRGLNMLSTLTEADRENLKNLDVIPPLSTSSYKYIRDAGAPPAKPYYSRWKDTAYVDPFKALQFRIRWTKSNYTAEDKKNHRYFHVPADQLREYPGFVYHCHILHHEDNEMMRPIMPQLPKDYPLNIRTPCNNVIEVKRPATKWSDKYNCINVRCGNQVT